jgi:hypothetical protein
MEPEPRIQMKASAPIARLSNSDVKTSNPMSLKTIAPKVVTAPQPVQDTIDRIIMLQSR